MRVLPCTPIGAAEPQPELHENLTTKRGEKEEKDRCCAAGGLVATYIRYVCLVRVRPPACTGEGGVHPTTIRLERHMRKSGLELFEKSKRRWKLQNSISVAIKEFYKL
jgi:hypothetical protein